MKRVNLFNPLVDKAVSGTGECVFGTIPQIGWHLEDQDELKEKRKKKTDPGLVYRQALPSPWLLRMLGEHSGLLVRVYGEFISSSGRIKGLKHCQGQFG